jgi:hypothetical protein
MKSGEAELGSAGEQPNRNSLIDWNRQVSSFVGDAFLLLSRMHAKTQFRV